MVPKNTIEENIQNLWRAALIKKLDTDRWHGCAYQGLIGEWHPTEDLLQEIAKTLKRNYNQDLNDKLRKYLVAATAKYQKEKGYF